MVDWKLNKVRDIQLKLMVIGMPIGFLMGVSAVYYALVPDIGLFYSLILIIILILMYGPGTYLAWKYLFSKNPKYIGISKDGIYFSDNRDDFEDNIYWDKIKEIKSEKNPQGIEVKTIILKDGKKRELTGIDKENIERITYGFEMYG